MVIKRVVAGIYGANCYIIMDESTKEAVVLDPGGDVDDIEKAIVNLGAEVKYILLTHGHLDHTGGVDELHSIFNSKIGISEKDYILMEKGTYVYGGEIAAGVDMFLKDKDEIKCGNFVIECIETPGHTPGGLCFKIESNIFTGDTLFNGSIGRTDLVGGDYEALMKSIKEKLISLSEDTVVYPGHGPSSTLAKEKLMNPFIRG
ncbi:MAG: MBL fold metallo-hydrolase [Clostridium argentinense]|uniref:MBL fold metallo-hydrolase n=1 Tax=Clostridium faecium TaxID=2762223 RepID=A0ABR8YWW0_9CLOT|nr:MULTISPECIES: MBL fold metallo-hydrolase [Clostridium]MBD8048627.1 MBL fold metallo-hydrolase [Clostridium faecium]MBS5822658.1 MBL fold metallo-hydrolase [Clostridium argentinense]MDU1347777.1 MBL fold metallo-hydrolase [Clostridium argentinense]